MILESVYDDMNEPEKQVAEYLKKLGLYWLYEFPVFVYDDKGRPRVWTPDFYIPRLGMYVEVCGTEKHEYQYREEVYSKNGFHVIFLHMYKGAAKWKNYLIKRTMEIEESRHDEVMKMLQTLQF